MTTNKKTSLRKIYLNKAQEKVNLVRPWSYYGIHGRGTGKSTRILAMRAENAVFQMKGSCLCFFGNSYMNLGANIVPKVISGWKELGYVEGFDFVVGQQPPPHFKPLISPAPDNWKHTMCWANGSIFHLGSMDRMGNILSHSFQHFFGDEARILDYHKVSQNAFPTVRGERIRFGNCTMFGGFTFTTDMPDPEDGQWLLEKSNLMDNEQIELIVLLALEESKLLLQLSDPSNADSFGSLSLDLKDIQSELNTLRHKSVFFDTNSSLVNVDALGIDYIDLQHQVLSHSVFLSSILNILTSNVDTMFYFKLDKSVHYLNAHFNYNLLDRQSVSDFKHDSRSDLHTDPERELFLSLDFGNMNCLVIRQLFPGEDRAVKCMHVLQPMMIDDLADKFCAYYKFHRNKRIHIYYDRAGNNRMPNSRKTLIQQFRDRILEKKQGWMISHFSTNLRNVPHSDRRSLINRLLAGMIPNAPRLTFDKSNCPELCSSIQIAKVKPGTDDEKDKSSEKKRDLQLLPMYSTNYSDAYDYGIWGKYYFLLKSSGGGSLSASVSN